MMWNIFHSTRYDCVSAVRDNVYNVCLEPVPIPEQTVESFFLNVLPASRLTHFLDLFSNRISCFEISEPHRFLVIEAESRVSTRPSAPLPTATRLCPFAALQAVPNIECWFNFLRTSRFVGLSSETWKLALDATHGLDDAWLTVLALMEFVFGYLKYESYSTQVETHIAEVARVLRQ
jgi:transglutaminase-like putative cysteine protease